MSDQQQPAPHHSHRPEGTLIEGTSRNDWGPSRMRTCRSGSPSTNASALLKEPDRVVRPAAPQVPFDGALWMSGAVCAHFERNHWEPQHLVT